jgi:hypothetical protein
MRIDNIISRINSIELKIDHNYLVIDNINFWPICRDLLIKKMLNKSMEEKFIVKRRLSLKAFFQSLYGTRIFLKKTENIYLSPKEDASSEYIFKSKIFHKHFSSLNYLKNQKSKPYLISIGNPFVKNNFFQSYDLSIVFILLTFIAFPINLISIIRFNKKIKLILSSEKLDFFLNKDLKRELKKSLLNFYIRSRSYKLLWKIIAPKKLIIKSFNNLNSYSAVYSANKLLINTIDYQHGQQGEKSLTYSNWKNIPKAGYIIMPKTFWVWENIFKIKFEKWMINQNFHDVKSVGNYWPDFYRELYTNSYKNPLIITNKLKILFCMQYPVIDDIMIKSLKYIKNVKWLIRMHPRTRNSLNDIKRQISSLPDIDFDIDDSNNYSFERVLSECDILITSWSTTAYEALIFGKISVVYGKNGYDAYEEFINQKKILYVKDYKSIQDLVKKTSLTKK